MAATDPIVDVADGTAPRAFLAIWHDIAPGEEAEFERWHTREHMPERVSLPGFERGRRGHAPRALRQRYVTLYDGTDLSAFASAAYRARLDDPTPWTTRLLPSFRDFARVACETIATAGTGVGGATATLRLSLGDGGPEPLRSSAPATAEQLLQLDGVSSVRVGIVRPEVTTDPTRESGLRDGVDLDRIDAVVLVDGIGERQLEAVRPTARRIVEGLGRDVTVRADCVYALSFLL